MSNNRLTPQAEREIEESFQMDDRCWRLLDLVVAEWESDPTSVACFDLRIVEEAKVLVKRRKAMKDLGNPFAEAVS